MGINVLYYIIMFSALYPPRFRGFSAGLSSGSLLSIKRPSLLLLCCCSLSLR